MNWEIEPLEEDEGIDLPPTKAGNKSSMQTGNPANGPPMVNSLKEPDSALKRYYHLILEGDEGKKEAEELLMEEIPVEELIETLEWAIKNQQFEQLTVGEATVVVQALMKIISDRKSAEHCVEWKHKEDERDRIKKLMSGCTIRV